MAFAPKAILQKFEFGPYLSVKLKKAMDKNVLIDWSTLEQEMGVFLNAESLSTIEVDKKASAATRRLSVQVSQGFKPI